MCFYTSVTHCPYIIQISTLRHNTRQMEVGCIRTLVCEQLNALAEAPVGATHLLRPHPATAVQAAAFALPDAKVATTASVEGIRTYTYIHIYVYMCQEALQLYGNVVILNASWRKPCVKDSFARCVLACRRHCRGSVASPLVRPRFI